MDKNNQAVNDYIRGSRARNAKATELTALGKRLDMSSAAKVPDPPQQPASQDSSPEEGDGPNIPPHLDGSKAMSDFIRKARTVVTALDLHNRLFGGGK